MRHGISEEQWIQYIEGCLPELEGSGVRDHASLCSECAATLRELTLWHEKLTEEAAQVRAAFATSPASLDHLLADSLERIRGAEAKQSTTASWSFREAAMLLRLLVEPFCGSGIAGAAISLAVRRSTVDGLPENTVTWTLFVSNMSETMASLCGKEAGRLVNQVGISLAVTHA
jgi:hypothetical protein